jgi:superfamily II DNA/RNA helicase
MQIAKQLPEKHQTIMFSATMPEKIRQMAKKLLNNPVEIRLAVSRPADKIHQMAYICYESQKIAIVKELFAQQKPERVIVFTGSKIKAKDLAISLSKAGFNCKAMHSDLTQQERDEVMYLFRSQQTDILVATDIVARGIDIDDITLVVNYDVPHDAEDYVHRIGRTARAGAGGSAITLVSEKDQPEFLKIERFLEREVEKLQLPSSVGEGPEYDKTLLSKKNNGRRNRHNNRQGKKNQSNKPQTKKSQSKKNLDKAQTQPSETQKKAKKKQNKQVNKC